MEICLIGCGKMGTALLAGWQKDSQLEAAFTVIDPALSSLPDHPATRYLHQLFEAYQFKADEAVFKQRFKRFVVANNSRKALLNRLSDLL